jgi:hypothetical protein
MDRSIILEREERQADDNTDNGRYVDFHVWIWNSDAFKHFVDMKSRFLLRFLFDHNLLKATNLYSYS